MLAPVRRLLAALTAGALVALCLLTWGAAPAQAACSCTQASGQLGAGASGSGSGTGTGTLAERIKAADAVFTGTVASGTRSQAGDATVTLTHEVVLDRVYKGRIDSVDQTVLTTQRTQATCGLGLLRTDDRYVFLVVADGTQTWRDDGCGGTRPATAALIQQVEDVLGEGRSAQPAPEPGPVELTEVDTTEPMSLSRAAAPGLALVLVGLLGLVLVGRLNARR